MTSSVAKLELSGEYWLLVSIGGEFNGDRFLFCGVDFVAVFHFSVSGIVLAMSVDVDGRRRVLNFGNSISCCFSKHVTRWLRILL